MVSIESNGASTDGSSNGGDKEKKPSALASLTDEERVHLSRNIVPNYMGFLDRGKVPEHVVSQVVARARESGLVEYNDGMELSDSDRGFFMVDGDQRQFALVLPGRDTANRIGASILGVHTDSPHFDLRVGDPISEEPEGAVFGTKPYGGVWLHGHLDTDVDVIGVFPGKTIVVPGTFGDRGIHITRKGLIETNAKFETAFPHDMFKVVTGIKDKAALLAFLAAQGFVDGDFSRGSWYVVPAANSRLNGNLITGYSHDDRACVYTTLEATLASADRKFPLILYGAAREEIGSTGCDSAESGFFDLAFYRLLMAQGIHERDVSAALALRVLAMSRMLSCDVDIALTSYDKASQDEKLAARHDGGLALVLANGGPYQGGGSLAPSHFVNELMATLDGAGVLYKCTEMPTKLNSGGGGTIAKFFGARGVPVIDVGVAVANMHGKRSMVHIGDIGQMVKGYRAFIQRSA